MSLPHVTANGRLTRDPETRFLKDGAAVLNFSIACNDRRKNPQTNEWEDGDTTFLDVAAWRKPAEEGSVKLRKGLLVTITGKLSSRSYEARDGSKRTAFQVTADSIAVDVLNRDEGSTPAPPQADPWAQQQPKQDPWSAPQDSNPPF